MWRPWNAQEDAALVRLYRDGVAVRDIAKQLHRSDDAVNARRRALAISARRARSWSAREDALLAAATRAGLSAPMVAERVGRGVGEVRWRRRVLGLTRPASRRYTAEEDRALRAAFTDGADLEELARRLGRSVDALRLRAARLGLHHPAPRRRWSPGEDAAIRDGYDTGLSCSALARELPGRTPTTTAARARKLGLSTHARRWTAADDERLRRLAPVRPVEELASLFGRTPDALRQRARKLQVALVEVADRARAGSRWTAAEDELLRLNPGLNPATLARLVARSDRAVTIRMAQLGLRAGRERSPHRRTPRLGGITPGERAVVERELAGQGPRRVVAVARRLELPGALIAMSAGGLAPRRHPAGAAARPRLERTQPP